MPNVISLELPLVKENILVARLAATGFAALQKLDIDTVEDLKVAVNEALVLLLKQGYPAARVEFSDEGGVAVTVSGKGSAVSALEEGDMSLLLLGELVDDMATTRAGDATESITLRLNR